jgi:hypothetical protein
MTQHIYDDFYIQCIIIAIISIAVWFLIDVILDPFKLQEE